MKKCDECGSSTTTITRFGNGGMFCGNCLRNGKKLSRARVDAYLEENGLVAICIDDLKFIAGKCNSANLVANEYIKAAKD